MKTAVNYNFAQLRTEVCLALGVTRLSTPVYAVILYDVPTYWQNLHVRIRYKLSEVHNQLNRRPSFYKYNNKISTY